MLTINSSSKWWVSKLTKATASSRWTTRPSSSKSKTTPCKCKWLSNSSRRWLRCRTKSSSSKSLRLCLTTHSHLSQFPVVPRPRQLQLQMAKKLRMQMPTRQTLLVQWMETKNSDLLQDQTRHYHINLWESHESTIKRSHTVTIIWPSFLICFHIKCNGLNQTGHTMSCSDFPLPFLAPRL